MAQKPTLDKLIQDLELVKQMAIDDISGKSNFKQDSKKLIAEYKKCKRERCTKIRYI